jgi:periplasmic divalent cation tolerance protein
MIITTTDSLEVTQKISKTLIKEKLAACVQYHKISSVYEWEGKLEESEEYRILIKTTNTHLEEATNKILFIHNYDLPQILHIKIDGGSKTFLDWLGPIE